MPNFKVTIASAKMRHSTIAMGLGENTPSTTVKRRTSQPASGASAKRASQAIVRTYLALAGALGLLALLVFLGRNRLAEQRWRRGQRGVKRGQGRPRCRQQHDLLVRRNLDRRR